MGMTDWRKSSFSATGNNCVEVASASGVAVRDTTDRQGPALGFGAAAWAEFLGAIR
jgi:hypothetical protein